MSSQIRNRLEYLKKHNLLDKHNVSASGSNELLCCPFCGDEVSLIDMTSDGWGNPYQIHCYTENCLGDTDWYPEESKDKLIKAWNTRPKIKERKLKFDKELLET